MNNTEILKNASNISKLLNNNTLFLVKLLIINFLLIVILILGKIIFTQPSIFNIVISILILVSTVILSLIIYRTTLTKLITNTNNLFNILLTLNRSNLLIEDLIKLKNLSILDMTNIRDDDNIKLIKEITKNINTEEGKLLSKSLLKKGGFINYNIKDNENIK